MNGQFRAAIIGGGINGIMTAWSLARRGHAVDLYERDTLMSATSHASTKLLHGGIRYLEHGEFGLVRESLRERAWWLEQAPHLAKPLPLYLPVTPNRPRWLLGLGLTLYDLLAGRRNIGRRRWCSASEVAQLVPQFDTKHLGGGAYRFYDVQMDDHALGLWAASQARSAGVVVYEHTPVTRVSLDGSLETASGTRQYDHIVNVAGPWAKQLLNASGIPSRYDLTLVRGSHLMLQGTLPAGFVLQVPDETRIVFVLPYQGKIMVGTTEVVQTLEEKIECSFEEREYLLRVYNTFFTDTRGEADIVGMFAGVRPLVAAGGPATEMSREYVIETEGRVTTVFGGKWTTARVLGEKVAVEIQNTLR